MSKVAFSNPVEDTVPKIDNEVAVGEDLKFQEKWWRFERVIWIVFTVLLLLALAGVFGRGPAAKAHIVSPDGAMRIDYDRIQRTGTPSTVRVQFGPSAFQQDGKIHLFVSQSAVHELNAQRVAPQPESSVVGEGGITYTFPASTPPASVEFAVQPSGPGLFPMAMRIPGGAAIQTKIAVLP